jgi:hypothetical protein
MCNCEWLHHSKNKNARQAQVGSKPKARRGLLRFAKQRFECGKTRDRFAVIRVDQRVDISFRTAVVYVHDTRRNRLAHKQRVAPGRPVIPSEKCWHPGFRHISRLR